MDEEVWLHATEADPDLLRLAADGSERKLRLLACAVCSQIYRHLINPDSQRAFEVLDATIDSESAAESLEFARNLAVSAFESIHEDANEQRWYYLYEAAAGAVLLSTSAELPDSLDSMFSACRLCLTLAEVGDEALVEATAHREQLAVLRDIFGNPFRTFAIDPTWRTSTAVALARGMYESRDFGAMPILADALQDAGCDNDDVLNHCRGDGPHVRGCWVVDLVLGKG